MEGNETPEEAVLRELEEELDYKPTTLEYFGQFEYTPSTAGKFAGKKIIQHVFLEKITEKLLNCVVNEGESMVILPIDTAIGGNGFVDGSTRFLVEVKRYLEMKKG